VLAGVALLVVVAWSALALWTAAPATPKDGSLRVDSDPPGSQVLIDGISRGSTPASMRLAAGQHRLVVERNGEAHERTVTIGSGSDVVHFVAWQPLLTVPAVAAPARVLAGRGVPEAAEPSGPAVALGWVTVASPERLDVYEGLRRMGSSLDARIRLPPGEHVLELTADPLGFRENRPVRIVAGRGVTVAAELPRVPVFVNAVPWADVLVDGVPVGQTPLGTLRRPIGTHQFEFRHPQLGTRRRTVVLSLQEVTRISVDMRYP